jgi:protein TonB
LTGDSGARGSSGIGGDRADYFDALFLQVVSALDYPRRARLEEIEGLVVLELRIDRSGRLESCRVAESSGSPLLDRHALRIARRAAPFGKVPASFEAADLDFELPLEFALTR